MKLKCWILSARDFARVDVVEAERLLRDHDWRGERAFLKELESQGKVLPDDCCTPGIGFIGGTYILHFVPHEDRTAECLLHVP